MAQKTRLECYKISLQPNLQQVAAFSTIAVSNPNPEFLLFLPEQIATVLKYETPDKFVWFFKYGCICFANFEITETHRFLKYLESTSGNVDLNLFSAYNENHSLEFADSVSSVSLNEITTILSLYAMLLAKSTELKFLENNLDTIFDHAERLVIDLQQGYPNPTKDLFKEFNLSFIRLQLTIINSLKILDRPRNYDDLKLRTVYDATAEYFELKKRFGIVQAKINNLIEILTPYQRLGFNRNETRLYNLEIILIALFPLFHLLKYFLPKILTFFHFL